MLYLALDQSTSATKALLFDGAGHALDREARPHQQHGTRQDRIVGSQSQEKVVNVATGQAAPASDLTRFDLGWSDRQGLFEELSAGPIALQFGQVQADKDVNALGQVAQRGQLGR